MRLRRQVFWLIKLQKQYIIVRFSYLIKPPTMEDRLPSLSLLAGLIAEKTGVHSPIKSMAAAGAGFHASGYRVALEDGRTYFLKRITSNLNGFEIPQRKLNTLSVSHYMASHAGVPPLSLGVAVENASTLAWLPQVDEQTVVYHLRNTNSWARNTSPCCKAERLSNTWMKKTMQR